MRFDAERVKLNAEEAETEDLLDRVTVFRAGMEAEALDIFERELWKRGVDRNQIEAHASEREGTVIWLPDGTAAICNRCPRPAVVRANYWHKIFKLIPVFPLSYYFCEEHRGHPVETEDEHVPETDED